MVAIVDSSAARFELSNHLKKAGGNFMRYMDLSINMLAQVMRKEGKDEDPRSKQKTTL